MGKISDSVKNGVLKDNRSIEKILHAFLGDFDISWGAKKVAYNTSMYVFIIKPSETFAETFGLDYELLLVYSPYESIQARTMQAINSFFASDPAKGRVESLVCIVVSDAPNAKKWVDNYIVEHQDLRTYIVFNKEDLLKPSVHAMTSEFRKQMSERDLFDIQLPLLDDLYFFGRQNILSEIVDRVKSCQNSGVFGLRKTGKTSLLYKIKRTVEGGNIGKVFIYDGKNAKIRMRTWSAILLLIIEDICRAYDKEFPQIDPKNVLNIIESFESMIKSIPSNQRIVIIIDEIEYISFHPPLDVHWKQDYFNLWQILWSMQSSYRNICYIIAGVNPLVVELSSIDSIQNPLFGIITPFYIRGLERNDIYDMSRRIGRRLGLKFDHSAIDYLYSRYGGHPLLSRLALSYENKHAQQKPILIKENTLLLNEKEREENLIPYCQHIVDVLRDFYSEEYTLLEFLALGETKDFLELASSETTVSHLKNYGLLEFENKRPKIGIPVVATYIGRVLAKEQGTQLARSVIPENHRSIWIKNSVQSIISYMRQLEVTIRENALPMLFGINSFPEAEKLLSIPVVITENDFKGFISTLSNCFVESIQNYGKSINDSNYFWKVIKTNYPNLFDALLRIKAYRNWSEHLNLTLKMQEVVKNYHNRDLEGKNLCEIKELYFVLQQRTIDELKLSISLEISNLS